MPVFVSYSFVSKTGQEIDIAPFPGDYIPMHKMLRIFQNVFLINNKVKYIEFDVSRHFKTILNETSATLNALNKVDFLNPDAIFGFLVLPD